MSSTNSKILTSEERRKLADARAARFAVPAKTAEQLATEQAERDAKKAANNAAAARKAEILATERASKLAENRARREAQNALIAEEARRIEAEAKRQSRTAEALSRNNKGRRKSPAAQAAPRPQAQTLEELIQISRQRELTPEEKILINQLFNARMRDKEATIHSHQNKVKLVLNTLSNSFGDIPPNEILDRLIGLPKEVRTIIPSTKFMGKTGTLKRGLNLVNNSSLRKSLKRSFSKASPLYKFNRNFRNDNNSRLSNNRMMGSDSRLNVGFLGHGLSLNDYVIVPQGYSVTFYTQCGIPLSMDEMLDSYYSMKPTYQHTYKENSVFNNLTLHINPLMGNNIVEYVGILPMVKGYLSPETSKPSQCAQSEEKVITEKRGYRYPIFHNIDSNKPEEYCPTLNLYNYNIGDRLSELTGNHTSLSSIRSRSLIEHEITNFQFKLRFILPLLRIILKDESMIGQLNDMFNPRTQSRSDESPFNKFNLDELLNKIKPGDYHFYMCRSFSDERLTNTGSKPTKRSHLSRQRSIKRNNSIGLAAAAACSKANPETSPIFNHFGGDNGKIAVLARFIENVLIPLISDPGMAPIYHSLEDIYLEESERSFKDYVDTFIKFTVSTKTKDAKPSYDELMMLENKRYSRFVNITDGDESKGEPRKIVTFKNEEVLTISPSDIEIFNNLNLLMYHLLMRLNSNIFKLNVTTENEELSTNEAILLSILTDITRLNIKLFIDGESIDKFFKKINISSNEYNVVHIDITNSS